MRNPFNGSYKITQGFGGNPEAYKKFGLKGHDGIDFALPTGTEVVAPHEGIVTAVKFDAGGYGNYIKIEGSGEGSVLAHLLVSFVKEGERVGEGQKVGLSDNTGNSTGPHLHWGYFRIPRDKTNGYAGYIDQAPFLKENMDNQKIIDELRKERDSNYNLFRDLRQAITTALELSEESTTDTIVRSINAYKGNAAKSEELQKQLDRIITATDEQVSTLNTQLTSKDELIKNLQLQQGDLVTPYIEQLQSKDEQITAMAEQIKTLQMTTPSSSVPQLLLEVIKRLRGGKK